MTEEEEIEDLTTIEIPTIHEMEEETVAGTEVGTEEEMVTPLDQMVMELEIEVDLIMIEMIDPLEVVEEEEVID